MKNLTPSDVTTCVLHYGNYPGLASRVMAPFRDPGLLAQADLRVGLNECSEETAYVVGKVVLDSPRSLVISATPQLFKYPMMRSLLGAATLRKVVMWFDDDACPADGYAKDWIQRLLNVFQSTGAQMMGSFRSIGLTEAQQSWISSRQWYNGKWPSRRVTFCQGSWWMAQSSILIRHGWPDQDIVHNGGDVMLGELCRQHGYKMVNHSTGMCINADESGKADSSKRRGLKTGKAVGVK